MAEYGIETTNVRLFNTAFVDRLNSGDPQMTKQAETSLTAFVRQKLREDGTTRQIYTPQLLTSADLDRDVDTDQPRKIVEKEPDSTAATISLLGSSEVRYFRGARYEVTFEKIVSKVFKKSKYELATYATDIRQVIQGNSVKDIHEQEDVNHMIGLKQIAAANHGTMVVAGAVVANPAYAVDAGYPYAVDVAGGTSSAPTTLADQTGIYAPGYNTGTNTKGPGFGVKTLIRAINQLIGARQKAAKILISYTLYNVLLSRPSTVVGSLIADSHFRGETMDGMYGYTFIPSIKLDILSSGLTEHVDAGYQGDLVAIFAPEGYLGQFYSLQEPTVFLKNEADMVEFYVYESVGIGYGNVQGFRLAAFDIEADGDA